MEQEKTTALELIRKKRGMTKADLARAAEMQQSVIGWIESRRFSPYDSQLIKIAAALDWSGDPRELLLEAK